MCMAPQRKKKSGWVSSATVANATPSCLYLWYKYNWHIAHPIYGGGIAVTLRLDNTGNCGVNTQEFVTIDLWNTLDVKVATFFTENWYKKLF